MSTTIDSIQIEIQASSQDAAKDIDKLSASLKTLEKSSKLTQTMANLQNLKTQMEGIAATQHGANKINALAGALKNLKSVGSFKSVVTNLSTLVTSLNGLSQIDTGSTGNKVKAIVDALAPLSAIKGGGFGTMVNSLRRLGEVTKGLDDATIKAFADRVKQLTTALEPLSDQMTTIKQGLSGVNTAMKQTGQSAGQLGKEVNATALNLHNMISVMQSYIQAIRGAAQAMAGIIDQAIQWDGIAARFGRGFGAQAQETYEWIQRLNDEMGINVQQFMQYSSVYATMLTGFGVAHEDATKMALGYTELTYDIWAGYNDIYRTYDEAAEAVKSAIAGEVEPVRRAGFTIVEATLAQTAANHGLEGSLETMTEAQKSYLRYLTMVDQAHSQGLVGTYAKELNTAEGLTRTLSQQVKSLAQAFGSLFLPILVRVLPWVQAFVELLTEAVHTIAGFFGIEIQKVDWGDYSSGVGGAVDDTTDLGGAMDDAAGAAKRLKDATMGFDELNIIRPDVGKAGGNDAGAGAGGWDSVDVDSLWDESIFDGIQGKVDDIKERFGKWLPVIGGIGTALAGLKLTNLLKHLDDVDTKLAGLGKTLTAVGITIAVGALVWDFTGAYLESGNFSDLAKALGTTAIGAALAAWLTGPVGAALVITASGIISLARLAVELKEGTVDFGDPQTWVTMITGGLEAIIGGSLLAKAIAKMGGWASIGAAIKSGLDTAYLAGLYAIDWVAKISGALPGILKTIGTFLGKATPWMALITTVISAIALGFSDVDYTEIGYKVGQAVFKAIQSAIMFFDGIGAWIADVGTAIGKAIGSAFDWVLDALDIDSFWEGLLLLLNPIVLAQRLYKKMFEVGAEILPGLWEGISSWYTNLIENIWEFVTGFIQGFKDAFDINSPSKRMQEIGRYVLEGLLAPLKPSAIKEKVVAMWESAKTWWNEKKAGLKAYTPSIGSIYEKLKERWDNARTWWNEKKTKAKEYTPSIGSIYEKLKTRWDNAKEWWNEKKTGFKQFVPSIGSIKDKLVSAWNTAKTWWNNNVKLSIPSLSFKVTYNNEGLNLAQKAIVKALGLKGWPKLSFAANGGIFDQGSLVWAGEHGAEIVANAGGGKTGVMNVEQMQTAVYEGVLAAMTAASRGNGENGNVSFNLYIDGKPVTASVEKRQRERGATIMGTEVYSY